MVHIIFPALLYSVQNRKVFASLTSMQKKLFLIFYHRDNMMLYNPLNYELKKQKVLFNYFFFTVFLSLSNVFLLVYAKAMNCNAATAVKR